MVMPTWAAGQLGGELLEGLEDDPGVAVPAVDRLLDGRPVEGDEGELRSDEDGGAASQEDRCEQEQPLRHRIVTASSRRPHRAHYMDPSRQSEGCG